MSWFIFYILVALISYFSFMKARFVVKNYEGETIPYSIGSFLVISILFSVLFYSDVSEHLFQSIFYLIMIWIFGLLDDIYGQAYPKGLKGHIRYMSQKRRMTTGIVKAVGTTLVSIQLILTWGLTSYEALVAFWLLVSFPHVMNLFDTRPLRVWKIAFAFTSLFLIFATPDRMTLGLIGVVFGIWFIFEGTKWALLGDNGATFIGALLAVLFIQVSPFVVQISMSIVTAYCIWYAERGSFSKVIESVNILKAIDQLGIRKT
ncbi:hypothetical protein [Bacillus sp. JCM 19034]|uniref:hypothetical protein n=1 Tax=Bacillus sp. JCM 19034 TaxID=1481928 RepID=UPI0007841703|nr:hypothetical protein [Bacillus sp. JCM 19034]